MSSLTRLPAPFVHFRRSVNAHAMHPKSEAVKVLGSTMLVSWSKCNRVMNSKTFEPTPNRFFETRGVSILVLFRVKLEA